VRLLLVVVALLLVSCGQSGGPVSSADCGKASSIMSSGRPPASLGADLPIPREVKDVSGTVLPAASGVEVPAGESTLAMPDPDVDRVVAVGKVASLDGLLAFVRAQLSMRDWRLGPSSNGSDGRFSLEYQGPGVSGSVVALACSEPLYLVTAEASPPLPAPDAAPFTCDRLRSAYPAIKPGAPGTCTLSEGDTRLQFTFARPPVDAFKWRPRLQELRRNARDYVKMFCGGTTGECATSDAFGARAAVSTVRDNDFWAGAQVELKSGTAEQARTTAQTAVRALTG
jgi:hypothetical protein